jgi:hypothetical protein
VHYEEGIAGLVRKRLDNRRLIDIPPFVLRELTHDALTVLVVAKFLGIVRVEVPRPESLSSARKLCVMSLPSPYLSPPSGLIGCLVVAIS